MERVAVYNWGRLSEERWRELFNVAKAMETRPSEVYRADQRAMYSNFRGNVVVWTHRLCDRLRHLHTLAPAAMNLFDRLIHMHPFSTHDLQFLGVVCVLVAGKFEANDETHFVPVSRLVRETNAHHTAEYAAAEIVRIERDVLLNHLQFDVARSFRTPHHFIDMLRERGIFLPTDTAGGELVPLLTREHADEALSGVLDLCMLDYECLQYAPSLVASACVVVARLAFEFDVQWPHLLAVRTGYTAAEVRVCAQHVVTLVNAHIDKADRMRTPRSVTDMVLNAPYSRARRRDHALRRMAADTREGVEAQGDDGEAGRYTAPRSPRGVQRRRARTDEEECAPPASRRRIM